MLESTIQVRIDLVAQASDGSYVLTLIEEGPWDAVSVAENLKRLSDRVCDCATAAINGVLAVRYPRSVGKPVIIHVNSFETPKEQVEALLHVLSDQFAKDPEIQAHLGPDHPAAAIVLRHEWVDWATVQSAQPANQRIEK